jgi:hypothetical protein
MTTRGVAGMGLAHALAVEARGAGNDLLGAGDSPATACPSGIAGRKTAG